MSTIIQDFEKHWDDFICILQSKINKNKDKVLTYDFMKLILSEEKVSWNSEYDTNGRWLIEYSKQNPNKGCLIQRILNEDMCFTRIENPSNYAELIRGVAPVVGAAVGIGVTHILHLQQLWAQIVSFVTPAVAAYPAGKILGTEITEKSDALLIKKYMMQLEKYKDSVISVLLD